MKSIILFTFVLSLAPDSMGQDCGVIPVTEWGESELKRKEPLPSPINIVIIQHTASPDCMTDNDCLRILRAIRHYHINRIKFDDIGPSFLVGGNGKVYEGAGWKFVGAHTRGYNSKSIGIAFIGDFREKLPTAAALDAAKNFINCGVEQKHLGVTYHLVGHRQLTKTLSPGDTLQKEIESWPHYTSNIKDVTK